MEVGLRGNILPTSEKDFADYYNRMRFSACMLCAKPFSSENVFSRLGWRETQMTGFCEICFDKVTADTRDLNA